MALSERTHVVLAAIATALEAASALPDSPEARELRDRGLALEKATKQWEDASPTAGEREGMMKKVLALHTAVTKVKRSSFPPTGTGPKK